MWMPKSPGAISATRVAAAQGRARRRPRAKRAHPSARLPWRLPVGSQFRRKQAAPTAETCRIALVRQATQGLRAVWDHQGSRCHAGCLARTVCRLDGDSRAYRDVFTACPSRRAGMAPAAMDRRSIESVAYVQRLASGVSSTAIQSAAPCAAASPRRAPRPSSRRRAAAAGSPWSPAGSGPSRHPSAACARRRPAGNPR